MLDGKDGSRLILMVDRKPTWNVAPGRPLERDVISAISNHHSENNLNKSLSS
jgi:hypothetical protein